MKFGVSWRVTGSRTLSDPPRRRERLSPTYSGDLGCSNGGFALTADFPLNMRGTFINEARPSVWD